VAQEQLALFEPLDLQRIRPDRVLQRPDGGIEIAVLLLQAHQRRAELAFSLFGHRSCAAGQGIFRQKPAPDPEPGVVPFAAENPIKSRTSGDRPADGPEIPPCSDWSIPF